MNPRTHTHLLPAALMVVLANAGHCGEAVGVSAELDGVPYRIDIPANHNGDLILLFHGYEPVGMPREQPWPGVGAADVFIQQGYAVAASAYRTQGWAVADALKDSRALLTHYRATYGEPKHVYAAGFSMGGHLALAALEAQPQDFAGALSLCGVNASAKPVFEDGMLTSLVALDVLFPGLLPAGGLFDAEGPPMLDPQALEAAFQANAEHADLLAKQTGIPRDGLAGSLNLRYLIMREAAERAGGVPVDNTQVRYRGFGDDEDFNARARRYTGDAQAMQWLKANAELKGRPPKPVLLFNNKIDPTVTPPYHLAYRQMAQSAGKSGQVAVWPSEGEQHCAFSPASMAAAMAALDDWAEQGQAPRVADH